MNRFTFILILLLGILFNGHAQAGYIIPENVKRILFLGNSITYSGQYVSYIEAYLTIRYPEKRFDFINVGLPSETVSGLSEPNHAKGKFPRPDLRERLERVLTQIKPDLVFACYGMNDGIYLPFDDARFQKYREGIKSLHEQVTKSGSLIVLLTPPVFDERKGKAYANVLDIYSDWLISCRYTANWEVIDIHWPMKKYLEERRLSDSTFMFAKDGVHPNNIGHWIMAKQVLLFLGEKNVAKAEDAVSALSLSSNGESILKLVEERQGIMKDAWLTSVGHKRPGMKTGLPLNEAQLKADEIDNKIRQLLK
ncbi:MAG: SGNH/GDSL hydrolase family protein [Bacteroidia bacterium]|nr:SGNH/GDSL hydrolase family protein [Bacteroidia bacterium]